jgi:hypothetical protein
MPSILGVFGEHAVGRVHLFLANATVRCHERGQAFAVGGLRRGFFGGKE